MEDEEHLISLIPLAEDNVSIKQGKSFESWNSFDQEVICLVFEELNRFNDLTMSLLDYVLSQ